MAGMFYSITEVSEKLGKSEDEVRNLVKSGRLREFRDGSNLLFKVDEVHSLMGDTSSLGMEKPVDSPAQQKPQTEAEAEEILLAPEGPETPDKLGGELELTDADTQIVEEGIKVLGETDTAPALSDTADATFKGLEESGTPASPAKESSLEEIEKDVSLDTFGSGSGLLDLSLQADDTSLGGILDEIYTPGSDAKGAAAGGLAEAEPSAEGSALEVAAEADQIISEAQFPDAPMTPAMAARAQALVAEPEPDAISNALGVMLFIPLLAIVYTAIVAVAGFSFVVPAILKPVQAFIWYVVIGLAVVSGLIAVVGLMSGGEKKPKAPKAPKPPKVKKEKPPKPAKK